MERKAIGIQGISTGSNYEDGACLNMVNMRHEQGVLKPVESFPVDYTLKHVYDLLYWHKNNDYAHLIGIRNNSIYWIQNPGEESETEGTSLLAVSSTVSISHIGNLINVIDLETLKYIFWQDNSYFLIDMDFDGEQTDITLGPVKIELRSNNAFRIEHIIESDENGNITNEYDASIGKGYWYMTQTDVSDNTIKMNTAKGFIRKALSMLRDDGLMNGFALACYAFELYDGSCILQSNPILVGQAIDKHTRYKNATYNYLTAPDDDYIPGGIAFTYPSGDGGSYEIKIPEESIDNSAYQNQHAFFSTNSTSERVDGVAIGYKMQVKIINSIPEYLRNIIKSVNIYLSEEIYQFDLSKDFIKLESLFTNRPYVKTDAELISELGDLRNFYKVHEISFDEIIAGDWIDLTEDLKGKLGDNLLAQQELITPSFSNIKAKNQMIYNSMLHAWNIKNVSLRGWPLNYFTPNNGIGQFQPTPINITGQSDQLWYIEVLIKTDTYISKVVRYSSLSCPFSDLTPLISYPDNMATQMTIYQYVAEDGPPPFYFQIQKATKKIFKLTASKTQNFAYYIAPDLKPITFSPSSVTAKETVPAESNQQLSYHNKLKVSNTNNPFIFPDGQTYQIGDGTILNVASQSIRTSDGQFGQYPLVCFCTDGVFTLQVGDGTVAYSKVGTPQNYERPISKVICVTPYGIAFISNRGLCMVVGQDIEYLSESMFEKFRTVTLELPEQIEDLFALDLSSFNEYLKVCTAMVYNPKEQEIIMIHPDKAYNYVYNMSTKQFYRNVEAITNEINNSLPDMQVWTGATIKKVTVIEAGSREISFVTRPIKMQTPDMKRFERVILRAYLSGITGTPATACIWGSIDDRNFKLLRGMVLENNSTRKDIDFGLFGKTTYRSYIIGLSMTVGTDSEVEAIEMQVEKEFLDTKMR